MNIKRILELADVIEGQPHNPDDGKGFSMVSYVFEQESCRTPACIAGWAVHLYDPKGVEDMGLVLDYPDRAADLLGLDPVPATDRLFHPNGVWSTITPAHAAEVLRHLAKTGKVDWEVGAQLDEVAE